MRSGFYFSTFFLEKALQSRNNQRVSGLFAPLLRDADGQDDAVLRQRAFDFLTCNGQRFHSSKGNSKDYVVIPSAGWVYPAGRIHGENIIIGIDWSSRKGVIRVKDIKKYKAVMTRYKRDLAYYKKNAKRLDREYKEAAPKLRSVEYWKQYLGME